MGFRRMAWYDCNSTAYFLSSPDPRPEKSSSLHLFWGTGLLRESPLLKEGPGPFPRPTYESIGNRGHFCLFCGLILVHTQDIKCSHSRDGEPTVQIPGRQIEAHYL